MATLTMDDLVKGLSLEQIAQIPRHIKGDILRAQAAPLVAAQREQALATFSSGPTAEASAAEAPVVTNAGGYIKVGFEGVRERKTPTPNAEIAFLNHYGVKNRNRATKFLDAALKQSEDESAEAGAKVLFDWQQSQL